MSIGPAGAPKRIAPKSGFGAVIRSLENFQKQLGFLGGRGIEKLGEIVYRSARYRVPVDTRKLQRSIKLRRFTKTINGASVVWAVTVEAGDGLDPNYAAIREFGTTKKNYQIIPKNKPNLVFFWKKIGRVVRMKRVVHPGSKETPYMRPALEKAEKAMGPLFRKELDTILHNFVRNDIRV